MRHLNWIISAFVAAGAFGSGEIKNSEKSELKEQNQALVKALRVYELRDSSSRALNEELYSMVEKLSLKNDSLEQVIAAPIPEKKCPECPPFNASISLKPSGYIFKHNDKYYQAFTYDRTIGVFVLDTNLEVKSRRPDPDQIKTEIK